MGRVRDFTTTQTTLLPTDWLSVDPATGNSAKITALNARNYFELPVQSADVSDIQPDVVVDNFTGANGDPWDAPKWQAHQSQAAGGTSTIQSNAAQFQTTAGGYAAVARRSKLPASTNVSLRYKLTFPGTAEYFTGASWRARNWTAGLNLDGYILEFNAAFTAITRSIRGVRITVWSSGTVYTGTRWVRVEAVEDRIRFKTWADGDVEPTAWTAEVTDPAPILTPGEVGLYLFSGAAAVTQTVTVEDFSAVGEHPARATAAANLYLASTYV